MLDTPRCALRLYPVVFLPTAANKIVDGERYATVEGNNVTAHLNQGKVFFDYAQVISANNFASNVSGMPCEIRRSVIGFTRRRAASAAESQGVAHIIDAVLLPVNWTQWMH